MEINFFIKNIMDESNKKDIELIISEQTDKLSEIVNYKIEKTSESFKEITTVVSNTTQIIIKKTGMELISESSLTEEQKKLACNTYNLIKPNVQELITDINLNSTIKITHILTQTIKQLEKINVNNNLITGIDKKSVAIELGRILLKELLPEEQNENRNEILALYDILAEPTLEAMIDVSKVVNVVAKEITAKCCPSLLTLFKK